MEAKEKVLATMKEAGAPLNAGKIAELSGLDRKEVDKAMKQLKEEGAIVSPVRCKWAPAEWPPAPCPASGAMVHESPSALRPGFRFWLGKWELAANTLQNCRSRHICRARRRSQRYSRRGQSGWLSRAGPAPCGTCLGYEF